MSQNGVCCEPLPGRTSHQELCERFLRPLWFDWPFPELMSVFWSCFGVKKKISASIFALNQSLQCGLVQTMGCEEQTQGSLFHIQYSSFAQTKGLRGVYLLFIYWGIAPKPQRHFSYFQGLGAALPSIKNDGLKIKNSYLCHLWEAPGWLQHPECPQDVQNRTLPIPWVTGSSWALIPPEMALILQII